MSLVSLSRIARLVIIALFGVFVFSCSEADEKNKAPGAKVLGEYLQVAIRLMNDADYDSAIKQLELTDSLARVYGNKYAIASVWANYGWISKRTRDLDSAVVFYLRAIEIDKSLNDSINWVSHLNQMADVFREQARFSLAATTMEEVIDLSVKVQDSVTMAFASMRLGNVLLEIEEREKAIKYYDKSLELWGFVGNWGNYAIALQNKADALIGLGRLDESLELMRNALVIKDSLNKTSSKAYSLTSLGRVYLLLDSIEKSEEVLHDALKIRSAMTNNLSYGETLRILSRVSLAKKQYQKAESQLKEVEQIARDYNKADLLRDAFEDQRALYKAWGKLAQLAAVDEVYDIMTDSLYREEKLKVQEAQSAATLQREQQKTQIAEQNARLTSLELASASQKAQFRLILVVIALMGVLVIAWQLMQIRKRNATLLALNARIKLITDNAFHSQKNALGLISALLRSKARQSQHKKELEVLRDVESKIEALGGVAKSLFQRRIEDNTAVAARVQLKPYLEELVEDTFSSVSRDADLDLSVDDIEVTSTEALNIGLIANEAITNFSKYAESAGADTLLIRVSREGEKLQLSFTDNGPGFPQGFDFGSSSGFGMQMMANLVEDMDGAIGISREEELTVISIEIPLKG